MYEYNGRNPRLDSNSSTNDIDLTGSRKLAKVTGISFVSDDSATSDLNSW
jgi:hypothetical protein